MLLVMEEEKERKIERVVQCLCVCVKRFYKGQKVEKPPQKSGSFLSHKLLWPIRS
jgi:hypothetical protein